MINKEYKNKESVESVLNYICAPEKTPSKLIGGLAVFVTTTEELIMQFKAVKELYHKTDGKQMMHFIVSFSEYQNLHPYHIFAMGQLIAAYYAEEYQIVYALHEDTVNPHLHFAMNTVSFIDGKKFNRGISDFYQFQEHVKMVTNLPHLTAHVMDEDCEINELDNDIL